MLAKGKAISAICAIILLLLTGCSPIVENVPPTTEVYATFYPIYALTQLIADGAENTEIHCLVQPQDECLRSYSLSDWDLYMLAYSADGVISSGNGLESFEEKLREMGETVFPVAEVMSGLAMEHFEDVFEDADSHFAGDNPHLYMSLNSVDAILDNIAGSLSILDASNAEIYEANRLTAQQKFDNLRAYISKQTEVCEGIRTAVLHEALLYPAFECGLDITASFERENGEMLYSGSLEECLNKLSEQEVQLVLIERQAPKALVDTLEGNGYAVALLDVMSTLQESDGADGYIETLKSNAQTIFDACSKIAE